MKNSRIPTNVTKTLTQHQQVQQRNRTKDTIDCGCFRFCLNPGNTVSTQGSSSETSGSRISKEFSEQRSKRMAQKNMIMHEVSLTTHGNLLNR